LARKLNIAQIEKELKQFKMSKNRGINKRILYASFGIVVVIVLFFVLIFSGIFNSSYGMAVQCLTKECLIEAANDCKPAYYETKIETLTLSFSTDNKCRLTKKVLLVDMNEPISIQNLFRSTSMKCQYNKGEFSRKYIDQISYDLMTCEGNMVEAIKNIL